MNIKEIRKKQNIKASDISNVLGFGKALTSFLENDIVLLNPTDAKKLANYLNCKPAQFYPIDELLLMFKNRSSRPKETLFGELVNKIQFRVNNVGLNLFKLAVKELGCTDLHDLLRKIIMPNLARKIVCARKNKNKHQDLIYRATNYDTGKISLEVLHG